MSSTLFTALFAAWLLLGIAVSIVLGRRGHDSTGWLLLSILLGPLSLLLAVDAVRHDENLAVETVATSSAPAPAGGLRVLIGYDDSPDAHAVIKAVLDLMGSHLQCLTLARVLPYDDGRDDETDARAALVAEARQHADAPIELEIIHGRPASALLEAATAGRFDLLAVGALGHAHSHLLGTTTSPLAHQRKIPLLICAAGLASGEGPRSEGHDSNGSGLSAQAR